MKLMITTFLLLSVITSLLFAQEKKDSNLPSPIINTQQVTNKGLSKQTRIIPKPQSNWSKIKDLFM